MTAREDGSDKKKQLMIIPGRGVRERFTENSARTGFEETRVTDLWASYSKGPVHSVFIHSMYLSSTCCGSGHPAAGVTVVNKAAPLGMIGVAPTCRDRRHGT